MNISTTPSCCARFSTLLVFAFLFAALSGCSMLKANPSADSGFIDFPGRMTKQENRYPFQRVWDSGVLCLENQKYDKIMFREVNTEHLLPPRKWDTVNLKSRKRVRKDLDKIALYTKRAFEKAVSKTSNRQISVVESSGHDTMLVELAIVGLAPAKRLINAGAIAGGIFVPGMSAVSLLGKGNVAIEAKVRDSVTGEVLATFADRERGKLSPFDIAGLTPYWHVKKRIREWAKQFTKLLDTPQEEKVKDSIPIRLLPIPI